MSLSLRPLLLLALLAICPAARGEPTLPSTFDVKAIDAYMGAQIKPNGYVGLSVAIVRDGKVVLAKGYGKRSLKPAAPVETSTAFESQPSVSMDNAGNAVVAWQRVINGNADIMARRVSSAGILGAEMTIAATSFSETSPSVSR